MCVAAHETSHNADNVEHDQFIEAVKTELKTGDGYVKDRQLSFLSSITSDVSDVTVQLLKKLNSETNRELILALLKCAVI